MGFQGFESFIGNENSSIQNFILFMTYVSGPIFDISFSSNTATVNSISNSIPNLIVVNNSSAGYATFSNGYMTLIPANTMKLSDQGILLECSSSNYLANSQNFNGASWIQSNSSIVANSTSAPDGTITGALLLEDLTLNIHQLNAITTQSILEPFSYSLFSKANTRNQIQLSVISTSNTSNNCSAIFNVQTGTVISVANNGGISSVIANVIPSYNGWCRCYLSGIGSGSTLNTVISLVNNGNTSYTGTGSSLYVWGAQLEVSEVQYTFPPSSYIVTNTGKGVRVIDNIYLTSTATSMFNGGSFSAMTKYTSLCNTFCGIIQFFTSGDTSNSVNLFLNVLDAQRIETIVEEFGNSTSTTTITKPGSVVKIAFTVLPTTLYEAINGGAVFSAPSTTTAIPYINVGSIGPISIDFTGDGAIIMDRLRIYSPPTTNAILQAITT